MEGAKLNIAACKGLIEVVENGARWKVLITDVVGSHGEQRITGATPKTPHPLAEFWERNEDYVFKASQKGINATELRLEQRAKSVPIWPAKILAGKALVEGFSGSYRSFKNEIKMW